MPTFSGPRLMVPGMQGDRMVVLLSRDFQEGVTIVIGKVVESVNVGKNRKTTGTSREVLVEIGVMLV